MKKTLGVVAAAAMAAMPVMGVFAADTNITEGTDTLAVTLSESCSFTATGAHEDTSSAINNDLGTVTVANGHLYNTESGATGWTSTYNVYCNDNGGWYVTAQGASDTTNGNAANAMAPSTLAKEEAIATGKATSGTVANWAFKLAKGDNAADSVAIETGYSSYAEVPATAKTVIKSNASTTAAGKGTFTTAYQVYVGTDTKADTYTGAVKYVLGHPASAAPSA